MKAIAAFACKNAMALVVSRVLTTVAGQRFISFGCRCIRCSIVLGLISYILSWRLWIPLGKLTFGAYLTHGVWLAVYIYTQQQPVVMSSMTLVSFCYHGFSVVNTLNCSAIFMSLHCQHDISEYQKKLKMYISICSDCC